MRPRISRMVSESFLITVNSKFCVVCTYTSPVDKPTHYSIRCMRLRVVPA